MLRGSSLFFSIIQFLKLVFTVSFTLTSPTVMSKGHLSYEMCTCQGLGGNYEGNLGFLSNVQR